jgi:hypothetical protein
MRPSSVADELNACTCSATALVDELTAPNFQGGSKLRLRSSLKFGFVSPKTTRSVLNASALTVFEGAHLVLNVLVSAGRWISNLLILEQKIGFVL